MKDDKMVFEKTGNVFSFEKSTDLLLSLADEKFENGQSREALSLYLEAEKVGKIGLDTYRRIADLYTELQMYLDSTIYWYKFLNFSSRRHHAEAYNGLAGNYYLAGFNEIAAYYFNLQINDKGDSEFAFDEYMYDLFYEATERNATIKLVDEQGDCDEKKIEEAKKIFEKEPERAYALLFSVDQSSSKYDDAQTTLAAFYMLDGNYRPAVNCYEQIAERGISEDFALNNLCGIYFATGENEKAKAIATILSKRELANYDLLIKYLYLFCAEEKHWTNYFFAQTLLDLFPNCPSVEYFFACACYNVKKYADAEDYFKKYYLVSRAYIAEYGAEVSSLALEGEEEIPKIFNFTFELPPEKTVELVKSGAQFLSMSARMLKRNQEKVFKFKDACFCCGRSDLQAVACQLLTLLNNSGAEKQLKLLLINPLVRDNIKIMILTMLVEMGNDKTTGLVYGNVYTRIPFERAEFTAENGDLFKDAYAVAFGRMAPYDEGQLYKLRITAYEIYYKLIGNGNIRLVKEVLPLAALIVCLSDITINRDRSQLIAYMGAKPEDVEYLQRLIDDE